MENKIRWISSRVALVLLLTGSSALYALLFGFPLPQQSRPATKPAPTEAPADSGIGATVALSDKELAALPTNGWPKSGGNFFNQNYSPLTQINRQTVANLKALWRAHLDGSGMNVKYSGEAQPIVQEGVIYIVTGADDVFAVSVRTGEILWKYKANLDETISTVCCGWTSRGLALGDRKSVV